MGEYLHNFKGIMKAAGLYHEIRWNVRHATQRIQRNAKRPCQAHARPELHALTLLCATFDL
jgi:hypothetical protein